MSKISGISAALEKNGLAVRGVLNFDNKNAPALGVGLAKSVLLVGHAGSSIWPYFTKWLEGQNAHPNDPLDMWSKEIINGVAAQVGGRAVFLSDKPYLPFQQWAMKAEGLKPSPLGMLIHPVYGLWHAYRGAILFSDETLGQKAEKLSHPCDACHEKPCLSACPVNAFSDDGYAVGRCRSHLATPQGQPCMSNGCLARRACPVGREHMYDPKQMRFHMAAFA